MKKILFYLLFCFFLTFLTSQSIFAQFSPTPTGNYYDDVAAKETYFDSIRAIRISQGDSTMQGTGFSKFLRWKNYWEMYMPNSGNYEEALEIIDANHKFLKSEHFKSYNTDIDSSPFSLQINPVNWHELGPKNMTKILTQNLDDDWELTHINNDGTLQSGAHVAKIDRLFQHPTVPNIIYACAGSLDVGGGGLFESHDYGQSWDILGTDNIPHPHIISFAMKPYNEQPLPGEEFIFIGLSSGAVYRSSDHGETWIESNYNGTYLYPYGNNVSNASNSLPYDNAFQNFSYSKMDIINDIKFTRKNDISNEYSRVVVSRKGGVYYSDNFYNSITPQNEMIKNEIVWKKMTEGDDDNFGSIKSMIPVYNPNTVERLFQFTDFEYTIKNGTTYYFIQFQVMEKIEVNGKIIPVDNIRQYICTSTDFGNTWQFLGSISAPESPHGEEILKADLSFLFRAGNIEVLKTNPNYVYVASTTMGVGVSNATTENSYSLKRFNLNSSQWEDFSEYNSFDSPINNQAHGFAIDPNNEENWWFMTNEIRKRNNGITSSFDCGYSKCTHADVRDILPLSNGILLAGTDGGVYRSQIGIDDHIMDASSEGLNAAQSYSVALAQTPPFYVASGFWHSGLQVYNPDEEIWHYGAIADGRYGEVFFLNNQRYSIGTQYPNFQVIKGFDDFNSFYTNGRFVTGSENISERSYSIKSNSSAGIDRLAYNNDDYNTNSSIEFTNYDYPYTLSTTQVIPNEPDKVVVSFQDEDDNYNYKMHIYGGMSENTPVQTFDEEFNIQEIYNNFTGSTTSEYKASLGSYVFDHRRNNKFWAILKSGPAWELEGQGRIVEYDPETNDFIDLSYPIEEQADLDYLPRWLNLTGLDMDRQTGVLYLGTTNGIYYLDRENELWRKYSKNLPLFGTRLDIRHCTGEIFASSSYRGIWYADLIRNENTPPLEWNITENTTWEERMNLFCTLVVEPGVTLTIEDELVVYGNQKIVVKPGGKLIIDGGIVTSECGEFWQGIEVHGNYQLRQNTTNQGVIEVVNAGTIEHARNGIRTIEKRYDETLDWSKTGGIVRVNGGIFKDCRHGIEFMSYHNLTPNGNESNNVSYVFNAEFITTDDFLVSQTPYAGVTMYDVIGVRIKNSLFEDQRSNLTDIDNTDRGSGIISVDANYKAISSYNISSGEPIPGTGNKFRNLYYGVMTYGGTGRSDVTINDNLFEECIYGVGLMGCNYGIIGRNQFNLPEFSSNQTNPLGYGVYTDGAYGFNIEENVFNTGASSNVDHLATNVRNSSVNASSGKVYRNTINNVFLGTQTIGDNNALEIDCNTYNKGKFSSVDIHYASGDLADQGNCLTTPAKNVFDGPCNNNNLAQILKNPSPVATDFLYSHQENTLVASCHNLGTDADECIDADPNECPDELANDIFVAKPIRIINLKSKLDLAKENLENVREVIASGDTEELIESIENDSPGDTKNALIAASPYLSDRVLMAYLTQDNTPPNGHIKQVLLANSPLSDTIVAIVNNMSLPNGILNQINNAQYGVSERRITEGSESVLNTNRLIYVDAIVQEYLDTNWVDSAAVFLEQEGSLEALCALVPIEVRRKDTTRANAIIATLRSVAAEMEENEPGCTKSCELNEYCDFQQSVFRIALRDGGYFSITPQERVALELMADSDARISVNAKAILHFIDQIIPEYKGEKIVFPKSLSTEDEVNELLKSSTEDLFSVHPNPTQGNIVFTIEKDDINGLEIIITDINGRVMKIIAVDAQDMEQHLSFKDNGVYLVHLVNNGEIQSTKKLIYAK